MRIAALRRMGFKGTCGRVREGRGCIHLDPGRTNITSLRMWLSAQWDRVVCSVDGGWEESTVAKNALLFRRLELVLSTQARWFPTACNSTWPPRVSQHTACAFRLNTQAKAKVIS